MTITHQDQVYVPGRLASAVIAAAAWYAASHPGTRTRLDQIAAIDTLAHTLPREMRRHAEDRLCHRPVQ